MSALVLNLITVPQGLAYKHSHVMFCTADEIARSACVAFHWTLLYKAADALALGKNWWDFWLDCVAGYDRCFMILCPPCQHCCTLCQHSFAVV
jgi:hypothetical protein